MPTTARHHHPVISPRDGSGLAEIELSDAAAVSAAVTRAAGAFPAWSSTPVKERVQPLFRFKQLVEDNLAELAELASAENGKLVSEAVAEIQKGLEVVEFATSLPVLLPGQVLEVSRGVDCQSRRFPLGVTVGITPFNFPAMVPMWMFPIAIGCGNTFLLKPSEQVPLTPVRLGELLRDAGLPDGVFSVVQGDADAARALADDPGVAAVAFVGSTPAARAVHARATAAGKRVLALGGAKNHLVVVPDADPEITAENIVASATGCAGQRCMAASVLVAVGDCSRVISAIADRMRGMRVGRDLGAVISPAARERIESYITRAEDSGAEVLVDGRGQSPERAAGGTYVGPTLIDRVSPNHPCAQDEIFGPVLTVLHAESLDEAIAIENTNPYGNAASIYTSSGATARYFEERASAGMVGVNIGVPVPREPFAFGGWNDSRFGTGDITGTDGIGFWTKTKKVTRKWTAGAAQNWMS